MNQLLPIIRRQRRPLLPVEKSLADEPSLDGARERSPHPSADRLQPIVADGAASVKASDANTPTPRKSR